MASKKGILLTAAIAIAVVGSSFLIYIVPRTSGNVLNSRSFQDTYSDVYTKSNETSSQADTLYANWVSNATATQEAIIRIDQLQTQTQQFKQELAQANPSPEWQSAFSKYSTALDNFTKYLDTMRGLMTADKREPSVALEQAKQEWVQSIDESVATIPVS